MTSGRTRQRRRGVPRGGRHGLSRPAPVAPAENPGELVETVVVVPPVRSRRATVESIPRAAVLSREAEYAYIRADMRRLFIIAAALMALMFLILLFASR